MIQPLFCQLLVVASPPPSQRDGAFPSRPRMGYRLKYPGTCVQSILCRISEGHLPRQDIRSYPMFRLCILKQKHLFVFSSIYLNNVLHLYSFKYFISIFCFLIFIFLDLLYILKYSNYVFISIFIILFMFFNYLLY